eukprot:428658-Rhodomonas_salina.3
MHVSARANARKQIDPLQLRNPHHKDDEPPNAGHPREKSACGWDGTWGSGFRVWGLAYGSGTSTYAALRGDGGDSHDENNAEGEEQQAHDRVERISLPSSVCMTTQPRIIVVAAAGAGAGAGFPVVVAVVIIKSSTVTIAIITPVAITIIVGIIIITTLIITSDFGRGVEGSNLKPGE